MNGSTLIVTVIALAGLLVGCGPRPMDSPSLQDTRWVLVALGEASTLAGKAPSVEFSADQIRGSAGCNTYFGTYEVSGGELSIGDLAVTEMWCMEPEGVMDQEKAFLNAFSTVASYQVETGRLELYNEAGTQIMVFGLQESALIATIETQESLSTGKVVNVRFTLTNVSSEGFFLLFPTLLPAGTRYGRMGKPVVLLRGNRTRCTTRGKEGITSAMEPPGSRSTRMTMNCTAS